MAEGQWFLAVTGLLQFFRPWACKIQTFFVHKDVILGD